jgi:hypothetical protein
VGDLATVEEAAAKAVVAVMAAVEARDHTMTPRKMAGDEQSQVTFAGLVTRSATGPRTTGPRPRRWARPIYQKKRRAA